MLTTTLNGDTDTPVSPGCVVVSPLENVSQQQKTLAKNLSVKLSAVEKQVQLIYFLVPQQSTIRYALSAVTKAERHGQNAGKESEETCRERLVIAKSEIEAWLENMKGIIQAVEDSAS